MEKTKTFTKNQLIKKLQRKLRKCDIRFINRIVWASSVDEIYACKYSGEWTTYTRVHDKWYWCIDNVVIGELFLNAREMASEPYYDLVIHYSNKRFSIFKIK